MTAKEVATKNEILRGVVGSTAHGIAIEGTDDRDEMGIFIEPPEYVCGLKSLDHYIYRDQPEGVRSQPGDLDLTLYSLRKFCRLAEQGNPSVLILLWLPEYITKTPLGWELVGIRSAFVSRDTGARFLGYLVSQRMKLTGEKAKTVNRPELVEKYGYDTKHASHALRLGFEGIQLLTEGELTLPMDEPKLSTLRNVKMGKVNFANVMTMIDGVENTLRHLVNACEWETDRVAINKFLVRAHCTHWSEMGMI